MELFLPDTDHTLPSGSASASRCTYTFGNALIGAAKLMKDRIRRRAADMLMAPDEDPGGADSRRSKGPWDRPGNPVGEARPIP